MGRVLITTRSVAGCEKAVQMLRDNGHEIIIHIGKGNMEEEEFANAVIGADALIVGVDPVTRQVINAGIPSLKIISRNGVGYNNVDWEYAKEKGIAVTITPGASAVSVSELALGMMFTAARHICEQNQNIKNMEWKRQMGFELTGKTLGIIGCGSIGTEVAIRAAALGMRVLAYDICPSQTIKESSAFRYSNLSELVSRADIITLHLPVTDSTYGMVNRKFLSQVKRGTVLINTARGKLVNEYDIAEALVDGALGYYATDTLSEEPAGTDNPLLNSPNALITPHCGAYTKEAVERCSIMVAEEVNRVLKGEKPLHNIWEPI